MRSPRKRLPDKQDILLPWLAEVPRPGIRAGQRVSRETRSGPAVSAVTIVGPSLPLTEVGRHAAARYRQKGRSHWLLG